KSCNVDGSVGIPHVRVEHRRGFIKEKKPQVRDSLRFFVLTLSQILCKHPFQLNGDRLDDHR
ncbi:hypothetical protein Q7Y60_07910, partial [Glaesserella parasuis]|nr:hypothetical protein [Glaesserella parasuis]